MSKLEKIFLTVLLKIQIIRILVLSSQQRVFECNNFIIKRNDSSVSTTEKEIAKMLRRICANTSVP